MPDYNETMSAIAAAVREGEAELRLAAKTKKLQIDTQLAIDIATIKQAGTAAMAKATEDYRRQREIEANAAKEDKLLHKSSVELTKQQAKAAGRSARQNERLIMARLNRHTKIDIQRNRAEIKWFNENKNRNYPAHYAPLGPPYPDHPADPDDPLSASNWKPEPVVTAEDIDNMTDEELEALGNKGGQ